MRTRTILAAAAFAVAIIVPAQANAATLRVVSTTKTLFGESPTQVGSARAYLDSKGKSHALKRNTALGQVAAASAYTGTSLTAIYTAGLGAYITQIAGVSSPKTGYWALVVNNRLAMLGAADVILKKTDEVVWIADEDYLSKNGPFVYNLDAKDNGDGTVTFSGYKIGGPKPVAAAGTLISVSGVLGVMLDAKGKATVSVAKPWTASIGSTSNIIGSETLTG